MQERYFANRRDPFGGLAGQPGPPVQVVGPKLACAAPAEASRPLVNCPE